MITEELIFEYRDNHLSMHLHLTFKHQSMDNRCKIAIRLIMTPLQFINMHCSCPINHK